MSISFSSRHASRSSKVFFNKTDVLACTSAVVSAYKPRFTRPCITIDIVIQRSVRLSAVFWLDLLIFLVVVVWPFPVWSRYLIILLSVVAAAIVILVGSSGNDVGSASIAPWKLAIVRVPHWGPSASVLVGRRSWGARCSPFLSSSSCGWSPSFTHATAEQTAQSSLI